MHCSALLIIAYVSNMQMPQQCFMVGDATQFRSDCQSQTAAGTVSTFVFMRSKGLSDIILHCSSSHMLQYADVSATFFYSQQAHKRHCLNMLHCSFVHISACCTVHHRTYLQHAEASATLSTSQQVYKRLARCNKWNHTTHDFSLLTATIDIQ